MTGYRIDDIQHESVANGQFSKINRIRFINQLQHSRTNTYNLKGEKYTEHKKAPSYVFHVKDTR